MRRIAAANTTSASATATTDYVAGSTCTGAGIAVPVMAAANTTNSTATAAYTDYAAEST